ncbi:putative alpha/beta hydrolase [Natronospira proteinivora]|uniref:Alpha/beta hydrolase n=1 Tax=Natronospira proteinivora TaxID=1807133 RepID=A0ABT1G8W7_9GAMM|nr:alpha/beta fold hydrolase [Natronospira proteinivora]MCP1727768.1 putative alpha/beta hydrolase [Natronospira proteinivora]
MRVEAESHFLPIGDAYEIHLRRFPGEGPMLLLLHGAIENGRIFYSRSGRGLAPWLAGQGFDVWVMDLGGRGESRPPIHSGLHYSQTDSIRHEIPAAMDYLANQRPGVAQHWLAHSWGGVMMTATLARYPERIPRVASLCFFGSKRRVRVWNWQRLLYVDLIWCWLSSLITRLVGYLPARRLKFGSDDESRLSHAQGKAWVRQTRWVDPEDGFDYHRALSELTLPPALYLAGAADPALGHPEDVKRLMAESGQGEQHFRLLARAHGNQKDYGHIDMLTAPSAAEDHFPEVAGWLQRQGD